MPSKHKRNLMRSDNWSYGGVERRDFRQTKDGPEVTGPPRKRINKGMCKRNNYGKHQMIHYPSNDQSTFWSTEYECIHCGKTSTVAWMNYKCYEFLLPSGE